MANPKDWKNRKRRKPKIVDKKRRGEWAELRFMVRAVEHDLPVSKPWGDSRSYDCVVGWPGRFKAVQVKSTTLELEDGGYTCCVCGGRNTPYPPGSFDFLAAYVIWDDAWYIIPAEMIEGQVRVTVYPQSGKSKYAPYREAWHLLGAGDEPVPGKIDSIQGCAEEFSAEMEDMMPPLADTKVPRFARDDNYAGNLFGNLVRRLFLYNV